MPTLFYATADWHVPCTAGGGAWAAVPRAAGDSLTALRAVAEMAAADRVPLVAAGDLWDGPRPDALQVAAVLLALSSLAARGLPLYYVLGNHDGDQDWLRVACDAAVNVSGAEGEWEGVTYCGLSYTPDPAAFSEKIRALGTSPSAVGLYHQGWKELINRGRYQVTDLPAHALAVVGDVHVRRVWSPGGGPRVAISPGPLAPQSVAEFGPVHAYRVRGDAADRGTWSVEPAHLPHRHAVRVACGTGPTDMGADDVTRMLSAHVPDVTLPAEVRAPLVVVDWAHPGPPPAAWKDLAADRDVILWVRPVADPGGVREAQAPRPVAAAASLAAAARDRLRGDPEAQFVADKVLSAAAAGRAAADRAAATAREEFDRRFPRSERR